MFAGTSISLLVGGAAFVRAEFFSRWNRTFTPRMGTLLLSHSCLLRFMVRVHYRFTPSSFQSGSSLINSHQLSASPVRRCALRFRDRATPNKLSKRRKRQQMGGFDERYWTIAPEPDHQWLSGGLTAGMVAEAGISIRTGHSAFVRAEFFSRFSGTCTRRMGAFLLLSHDSF